jgi:hypothetical protein
MGEGEVSGIGRRLLLTSRRTVDLCRVGSCLCRAA